MVKREIINNKVLGSIPSPGKLLKEVRKYFCEYQPCLSVDVHTLLTGGKVLNFFLMPTQNKLECLSLLAVTNTFGKGYKPTLNYLGKHLGPYSQHFIFFVSYEWAQ